MIERNWGINYEYPHQYFDGGTVWFETEAAAREQGLEMVRGKPGMRDYCRVILLQRVEVLN